MFGNFSINLTGMWNKIANYFMAIQESPIKLIPMLLDLLIVVYLAYKFIKYAKNSRVWQILRGILLIIVITIFSDILEFKVLNFILTVFMPYGVIAIIVIFAPELRRMLEQLGTNKLTKFFGLEKDIDTKTKEDIYKIVIAALELSKEKMGGLIAIEKDISISDIIEGGVRIDADVSPQLIVNLFTPKSPLHDGAVIISKNKIAAAACILPLTDDKNISKDLGTRHRAAIGVSKETDSIAVVISEETSRISIAKDGKLITNLDEETLRNMLLENLMTKKNVEKIGGKTFRFVKHKNGEMDEE